MADCVFCRIAGGQIPATILFQDELAVAFRDLSPRAPTHVLIVPREHLVSVAEANTTHEGLLGHLVTVAAQIAREEGISEGGYRLVFNHGPNAGQSVFHVHLHLLGGREFEWPPG